MDIVKLMIEKGANDWNDGMYSACQRGHMEVVKYMIEKGAKSWNDGIYGACLGGHGEIVKLMIEKGATHCGACGENVSKENPNHY